MNVGQLLVDAARRHPARPAVTWGDRRLDYRLLDRRTNALARALAALGASRGDRVGPHVGVNHIDGVAQTISNLTVTVE